jgi:aldehyde dehydrogenase family 7 protein A1
VSLPRFLDSSGHSCCYHADNPSGQRCTSTRRIFLHKSISQQFISKLLEYYDSASPAKTLPVGDPLEPKTLVGPLHTRGAVEILEKRIEGIKKAGGEVLTKRSGRMGGGPEGFEGGKEGNYVWPAVARPTKEDPCWQEE